MAELILFIVIGAIAVAAAVMMLLSENTVYSALFLTLNFLCVALLFLLLNAPFLAMVQVAVYAGAIMVLFLFVIMLLGAEKTMEELKRFRWFNGATLALALILLVAFGLAIGAGQIDLQEPVGAQPMVRVIHAAPDAVAVDVRANDVVVAQDVAFGETSEYVSLPPGTYNVALFEAGTDVAIAAAPFTFDASGPQRAVAETIVAYGDGAQPVLASVFEDFRTVENEGSRLRVFNATGQPVQLIDPGVEFNERDAQIVVDTVEPGTESAAVILPEGVTDLVFIPSVGERVVDGDQSNLDLADVLFRLRDYEVERDTAQLMVLTDERQFDDTSRVVALPLVEETLAPYGSPKSIGQLLLTTYLLPFEMVSILLLVAMVGAVVLTQRYHDLSQVMHRVKGPANRRRVARPLTNVVASQLGTSLTNGDAAPQSAAEQRPELEPERPAGD